jgi:hypothetical protein
MEDNENEMIKHHHYHDHTICDNLFWVLVWLIITCGILGIVFMISLHDTTITQAAFAAGYEETVLPGSQSTHWVKAK